MIETNLRAMNFGSNMSTQSMQERYKAADGDSNGEINKTEFDRIFADKGVSSSLSKNVFERLDKDGSGAITKEEREQAIEQIQQRAQKIMSSLSTKKESSFDSFDSILNKLGQSDGVASSQALQQRLKELQSSIGSRDAQYAPEALLNKLFPEIDEKV